MGNSLFEVDEVFEAAKHAAFQGSVAGYVDVEAQRALRLARSRRLETLRSIAVFPCGSVITSVGPLGAFLTPAVAAVTTDEFVIMPAEAGKDIDVEYGRVARRAVTGVEVFDGEHVRVPEDVLRSEEESRPDVASSFVLMVTFGAGRSLALIVRSAVEARRARDRFREWSAGPDSA